MQVVDVDNMLPIGALLRDTYIIDGYLASGGFGKTYLVHHKVFGDRRAIKEYFLRGMMTRGGDGISVFVNHPSHMAQVRMCLNGFMDEARRMHQLNCVNIVKVHDVFEENNTAYYVMDYINGQPLNKIIKARQGPLTNSEVWSILDQMLNALNEIHSKGLWHLDIKPSNIMFDDKGRATLIDFGTSKQIDNSTGEQLTSAVPAYTPGYAPGEQQEGQSKRMGAWSDLYSLGATIYHLLTSLNPPSVTDIYNDGIVAFRFLPDNDKALSRLAMWLMNPRIEERPHSVAEVRKYIKVIEKEDSSDSQQQANNASQQQANSAQQQDPETVGLGNAGAAAMSHGVITSGTGRRGSRSRGTSAMKGVLIGVLSFVLSISVVFGVLYWMNNGTGRKSKGSKKKALVNSSKNDDSDTVWVNNEKITIEKGKKEITFTYTGPLVNNLPNGDGTAWYSGDESKTMYEGPFVDGVREGDDGRLTYLKGDFKDDVYDGGFHKDRFEGKCTYYKSNGEIFKGTARNNELYDGKWYYDGEVISIVVDGKEKDI